MIALDDSVKLRDVLRALHEDGVIDCNQYQAGDFKELLKRCNKCQ